MVFSFIDIDDGMKFKNRDMIEKARPRQSIVSIEATVMRNLLPKQKARALRRGP
nr:hypothetical protein [Variovorax boronicumulans]